MRRYILAPQAERDLESIHDYIASEGSPPRARRMVEALFHAMDLLAEMPSMGRTSKSRHARGLRIWPVPPYLIFYRRSDGRIEIVRVVHGARDLDSLI